MQGPSPLVSILIPCYDSSNYLGELLETVQSQTCGNFEVLLLDDGSTDTTLQVIAGFLTDPRFHFIRWEKNRGVNAATLALLRRMRGEYWCHPDSDDLLYPSFIQERLELMEAHPEAAIVHGPADYIDEAGHPAEVNFPLLDFPPEISGKRALSVLLQHNIIRTSSVFVRSDITRMLLPYFHYDWRFAEDWHLWILHAATGFDVLWDKRALVKYRIHQTSLSCQPDLGATREALIRLVPLCALSAAAGFSPIAADLWSKWRSVLHNLWLYKAARLRLKCVLQKEWLRLADRAYYGKNRKHGSLLIDLATNLPGILLAGYIERKAIRRQSFRVSGIASVDDPVFL